MVYPDLEGFKSLLSKGNLIPVYREILADTDTPVSAALKLGGTPSFLLESVVGGEKWARYSFFGSRPSKVIRSWGKRIEIKDDKGRDQIFEVDDPLKVIKKEIKTYRPVDIKGLPRFYGGLVGYIGYDMVRFFERVPDQEKAGIDFPDMFFMVADTMLIFDGLRQTIKIVSNVCLDGKDPTEAYSKAVEKIENVVERLKQSTVQSQQSLVRSQKSNPPLCSGNFPTPPLEKGGKEGFEKGYSSSFITREAFEEAVLRAKEYIMSGDVAQVVLSQRFDRESHIDPFHIYRALRVINPSPYMYYIDTGDATLVGSSPEILVRLEGRKIILRPIAGTRRRGDTEEEDVLLETELRGDPKETAEHIMLVDLGRNDIGRVAETGSV